MSARTRQFLRDNDFYRGHNRLHAFTVRIAEENRKIREQHLARVASMSDTEKAVLLTATAVRDKMSERYQAWSNAGLLGRWLIGRNTKVLPLEHGVDATASKLTMSVRVPVDGDESDWLLQLSSSPYTKKGHSTRLAFANYRFSDVCVMRTPAPKLGEDFAPLPHFDIQLANSRIIDRHSPTESNNSLWPTSERAEQLRGILEVALPQL